MTVGRRVRLIVPIVAVLVALGAVLLFVRLSDDQPYDAFWPDGFTAEVRVVAGDRTVPVELTDLSPVPGRVAYEGPRLSPGADAWKPAHEYWGVSVRSILDRADVDVEIDTVTFVALDGWHKTMPGRLLDGTTDAGTPILALSVYETPPAEWDDGPMLVLLPDDEAFGNDDMLASFGEAYAHYFGDSPSTTGLMVKGVVFLVVNHDGGPLPSLNDLIE